MGTGWRRDNASRPIRARIELRTIRSDILQTAQLTRAFIGYIDEKYVGQDVLQQIEMIVKEMGELSIETTTLFNQSLEDENYDDEVYMEKYRSILTRFGSLNQKLVPLLEQAIPGVQKENMHDRENILDGIKVFQRMIHLRILKQSGDIGVLE